MRLRVKRTFRCGIRVVDSDKLKTILDEWGVYIRSKRYSELELYGNRFVKVFYECVVDNEKFEKLIEYLDETPMARWISIEY